MFEKRRNFSPPKKRIDKPYGFFSVHETRLLKGKKKTNKVSLKNLDCPL